MKKSQFETVMGQLKELAEKYAEFGATCLFKLQHHTRVGNKPYSWENDPTFREEGREITVYFGSDYQSWSVDFGEIKIIGYGKENKLPWAVTVKEMQEIYADALALYETFEGELPEKVKQANRARVEKEIKEMEAKLNNLRLSLP